MHKSRRVLVALLFAFLLLVPMPSYAKLDVLAIAQAEIAHIESQGFVLPNRGIAVIDNRRAAAVIFASPVDVVMFLRDHYWSEGVLRYVVAYEVGRLLAYGAGLPQDTDTYNAENSPRGNAFAVCFGSAQAREWARRVEGVTVTAEDCERLKETLKGTP